jgi:hypothetical protein
VAEHLLNIHRDDFSIEVHNGKGDSKYVRFHCLKCGKSSDFIPKIYERGTAVGGLAPGDIHAFHITMTDLFDYVLDIWDTPKENNCRWRTSNFSA